MIFQFRKYGYWFLLIWCIGLSTDRALAQTIPDDNTVAIILANYLYQFANYNDWPSERKKGPFTVAVVGNTDVYDIMSAKYAAKPIGSQLLTILGTNEAATAAQVHVLFIDRSKKSEIAKYVRDYKGKNTLIVTNWEGALAQGAHINFRSIDGSIRFELSKTAMQEAAITPGVKILQWAIQ
ncbi:MAG: YfiR family protein [Flavobacteriales bacterium]